MVGYEGIFRSFESIGFSRRSPQKSCIFKGDPQSGWFWTWEFSRRVLPKKGCILKEILKAVGCWGDLFTHLPKKGCWRRNFVGDPPKWKKVWVWYSWKLGTWPIFEEICPNRCMIKVRFMCDKTTSVEGLSCTQTCRDRWLRFSWPWRLYEMYVAHCLWLDQWRQ